MWFFNLIQLVDYVVDGTQILIRHGYKLSLPGGESGLYSCMN